MPGELFERPASPVFFICLSGRIYIFFFIMVGIGAGDNFQRVSMMKVSLVITTYNDPLGLKKAVESAFHQTRRPDEVLIADDGSDERTASAVKDLSGCAPFTVIHVRQEDMGFRAAKIRNKAIARASGDYIILLDGDCVMDKHFVADHELLSEDRCFIQGKRILVNRDAVSAFDHTIAASKLRLLLMAMSGGISNAHHLLRIPYSSSFKNRKLKGIKSCNMSFFKKDFIAVNGFNEDFEGWGNEDSELACRFFKYGLFKKVHPFMAVCFHLWHPTNKVAPDCNRLLLAAAIASKEYFCKNGLVKKNN
jgi:glycosyltransferase involved in cell wall biosynthesis